MRFVAIDWGTSSFRAWLIQDERICDQIDTDRGVKNFQQGEHAEYLSVTLAPWRDNYSFIISIGMIGSSIGLYETEFSTLPINLDGLTQSIIKESHFDPPLYIVPGVSKRGDVMRGEESQSLASKIITGVVLLPGTHSKWVKLEDNKIIDFRTYLTGELFEILRASSTLSKATESVGEFQISQEFIQGLDADSLNLTHDLFGIRAHWLQGRSREASAEFLSGLLIGSEIKSAQEWSNSREVVVVASDGLATVYRAALKHFGISSINSESSNLIDFFIAISRRVGVR